MPSDTETFCYRTTTRVEAVRFFAISLVLVIIFHFAVEFMIQPQQENLTTPIRLASYAVALFVILVFAVPRWIKNGSYEFSVSRGGVSCKYPDGSEETVPLEEIARLEIHRRTAGTTTLTYWIIRHEGKGLMFNRAFGLPPKKVINAIKGYLPNVDVVTHRTH